MLNRLHAWVAVLALATVVLAAAVACEEEEPAPRTPAAQTTAAALPTLDAEAMATIRAGPGCLRAGPPDLLPDPGDGVPGVPYPTPQGGRVAPAFYVPSFPGAAEIDGFVVGGYEPRRVQTYESSATADEVFTFFEEALLSDGYILSGVGAGPAGRTCRFAPYHDRSDRKRWIEIGTEYVGRDWPRSSIPPPGFRRKAVPFAPPAPGKLWFFVSTPE